MDENRRNQWSQDDSQGQQQYYGNPQKQGDYVRDINDTSTSLEEKEEDKDVDMNDTKSNEKLEQDEVDIPERERSTTPPYAGNSSERSHGYNSTGSTDKNDNSVN